MHHPLPRGENSNPNQLTSLLYQKLLWSSRVQKATSKKITVAIDTTRVRPGTIICVPVVGPFQCAHRTTLAYRGCSVQGTLLRRPLNCSEAVLNRIHYVYVWDVSLSSTQMINLQYDQHLCASMNMFLVSKKHLK